jgi:hypothetical protein
MQADANFVAAEQTNLPVSKACSVALATLMFGMAGTCSSLASRSSGASF